jgi:hypothetical protein
VHQTSRAFFHFLRVFVTLTAALLLGQICRAQGTTASPGEPPVALFGAVPLDPTGVSGDAAVQVATPSGADTPPPSKRGEFIVAPIPIINPTL